MTTNRAEMHPLFVLPGNYFELGRKLVRYSLRNSSINVPLRLSMIPCSPGVVRNGGPEMGRVT